ncbi:MAG: hypothetical protein K1X88_09020 [Nannocystaceae bacterium]|nr:hypothetical protein [Nannocystaceae bacterium]
MDFREGNGFDPFGWSVPCTGLKPSQVREEVRALVEWAAQTWAMYFPAARGYTLRVDSPAGASNGVQLTVSRGDFRAQVEIESILDPVRRHSGAMIVRTSGRATSRALVRAQRDGALAVQRGRSAGVVAGIGVFALVCWMCLGAPNPGILLATLGLVVIALFSTTALGGLGAYVGECVGESAHVRARVAAQGDPLLKDDLRRFRALVRELNTRRAALAGRLSGELGPTPFRALPSATGPRARTGETVALRGPKLSWSA